MKVVGNPVGLPRGMTQPVHQIVRIGMAGHDDGRADILIDNLIAGEPEKLSALIRAGFFRMAILSSTVSKWRDRIDMAAMTAGAALNIVAPLPSKPIPPFSGTKIMRGGMGRSVHDICHHVSSYRTLWRTNGAVAVLEWPIGGAPWLRPIDISEIEIMLDDLGVEADNSNGEAGYLLNRAAHAVMAALPSWLPPAGSVTITRDGKPAGYDAKNETICVIGIERTKQ